MSSLDSIRGKTEKAVSFVEWLAEVLRGKNWVTKLLLLDVLLLAFLNPASLPGLVKFLPTEPRLPPWYPPVFWLTVGLLFVCALIVAYRTVPRAAAAAADLVEHAAVKGLRPFGFEDAAAFARLQREASLRECLATVTDREFRFGVLCGESGCGKTSFLQAGLWPRLLTQNHRCVYVKFTELDPLESVRQDLSEQFERIPEKAPGLDLLALLAPVASAGTSPVVLLFDQFEQFFVHRRRKEERQPFIDALAAWYKSGHAPPIKILMCLRDDFYGRLVELQKAMDYSLGPQQSLRLEKFTPREAAAIVGVIAETENLPCDGDFVEKLTERELASPEDGLISAVDLQILAWMIRGQRSAEERAFNRTAFQKLGGLEGLLERFLSRALQVRETETRRQAALKVLLVLTDLERNARACVLSAEEVEKKLAGTVASEDVYEALQWLARGDVRLATPVERQEAPGYELAHERLIPALRRLAGKELSLADRANQLLDRRVDAWLANDRARRYLLTFREWRLIQAQKPFLVWGAHRSQKEALLAQSRRYWRGWGAAASLAALSLLSAFAWWHSPWGQIWQVKRDMEGLVGRLQEEAGSRVALAWAKAGEFERARETAEGIDDADSAAEALGNLAALAAAIHDPAEVAALFEQIYQGAEGIGDSDGKARVLADLAWAAAKKGDAAKARALIEEVLDTTEWSGEPWYWNKDLALSALIGAAAEIGDPGKAAALLGKFEQIAEGIREPSDKGRGLSALAGAWATIGAEGKIFATWTQAHHIAQGIGDAFPKYWILRDLAAAAVKLKDPEQSAALLMQLRPMAQGIDGIEAKTLALRDLAVAATKLKDPDKTAGLLEDIRQTADAIGQPAVAFEAVRKLAEAAAKRGDPAKAVELIEQARGLAGRMGDSGEEARALGCLALDAAKLGNSEQAAKLLKQGRRAADDIGDSDDQAGVLQDLAIAAARLGDSVTAADLLEKARRAAKGIDDLEAKAEALSALSGGYARLGEWRRARKTAAKSISDDLRATSMAAILEVWAERRNPALADVGVQVE